jgi:hypothetical protein
MGAFIDEIGNRYGRLTVNERAPRQPGHRIYWTCKCDCGEEVVVDGGDLRGGHTKSCGCLQRETISQIRSLSPGLAMSKEIYARYRWRAEEKGRTFLLSLEQFRDVAQQNCHYCGAEPRNIYNGLDRIDSNQGYAVGNVVPCCWTCNRAKGDMSYEDFLAHLRRIAQFWRDRRGQA